MSGKLVPILVLAVIAVAGCPQIPGFQQLFGTNQPVTTELPPDIITTANLNIIPAPPITADSEVGVSFEIRNQDDINEVKNVEVKLYDSGLCALRSDSQTSGTKSFSSFVPQQTELIEWRFDTPKSQQIGNLPATCPIRYKIDYDFEAKTQVDADVISRTRFDELQRAGTPPSFSPSQVIGRGPLKVSFSYGGAMPALNGSVMPVFINVEDKGTGTYPNVPAGALSIRVPENWSMISCDKFNAINNPSFEDTGDNGPASWGAPTNLNVPELDSRIVHSGGKSLKINRADDKNGGSAQIVNVLPNTQYRLSAWVKAEGANATGQWVELGYADASGSVPAEGKLIFVSPGTYDWKQVSKVFTTPNADKIEILAYYRGPSGIVWYDDISLVPWPNTLSEQPGTVLYTNVEPIPVIKKVSPQLRCSFKAPDVDVEKTYYLFANLPYRYSLVEEQSIDITPTLAK